MTDHIKIMASLIDPWAWQGGRNRESDRITSMNRADAIEAALTAAGYQIVPVVPTEDVYGLDWERLRNGESRALFEEHQDVFDMLKAAKDQQS